MALRVGYEKLHRETGWEPQVSWEEGVLQTIAWYAENRERWIGRVDWLDRPTSRVAMSVAHEQEGSSAGDELVERDGIYHRADEARASPTTGAAGRTRRPRITSAPRSPTGTTGTVDYGTLTGKIAPVWDRFPAGPHVRDGARDRRRLRPDPALPRPRARRDLVDLLRRRHLRDDAASGFVEYREQFAPAPGGRLYPICASADALPLEDDSVDLAITSAVFLHMGKSFVERRRRARSRAR